MTAIHITSVETLLAKLTVAADAVEFPTLGALTVEVFWSIVEARPEMSNLLLLVERQADRIRKAGEEYDSVTFASLLHQLLSEAADSYLAKSAREKLVCAVARLPQAGKDLNAPQIVAIIREAAALFLNRSSLRPAVAVVIDRPEGGLWANRLRVGRFFSVALRKTLRVPEDGRDYPLPPGFTDPFPIFRVQDYADKVPGHWLTKGGFFIPMHQREAMFLEFSGFKWHPQAAKIAVGNINAVTGEGFSQSIRAHRQDYVVIPDQKWLDGINSMSGRVRQFVAMPLGKGYTIEEQVTDEAKFGGIQLGVFDARPGLFPDEDPQAIERRLKELAARKERERWMRGAMFMPAIEMGIAAGGSIRQQIFEDQYGYQTWDEKSFVQLTIRIVDTVTFKQITGRDAPPTPISAEHYTRAGLPWFRYYEETVATVGAAGILARIRGVRQIDRLKGAKVIAQEPTIQIKPEQLREIAVPTRAQRILELRQSCESCVRAKRYAIGKRQADLLLELSPKDATGLMVRAKCNHRLSRFQESILDASEYLEETDPKDPSTPTALLYRGDSFTRLGKLTEAISDFEQVMSLVPDTNQARYAAEMLQKLRRPAKQQNQEISTSEEQQSPLSKNLALYNQILAERAEILKHKQRLSEEAGRDIGFEQALQDWMVKHRTAWLEQRRREQNAAKGLKKPKQTDKQLE